MKLHPSLPLLILAASVGAAFADTTVNPTSYPQLFAAPSPTNSDVTVNPTLGFLELFHIGGSAADQPLGTYWRASADGGAIVPLLADTGAQVKLTGSALEFNLSNNPATVLGGLGTGLALGLDWTATATFNKSDATLILKPNTTYTVSFDVDTGSGLLKSGLGITPAFGVSLLDFNTVVGTTNSTTIANILGLQLGTVVGSPSTGRATVQFKTGATVSGGAAKLRFTGSAALPVSVTNIGSNFARVSNLSIAPVLTPYETFIEASPVTDPVQQAQDADPDGDGRTNLAEFAVDSNPGVSDSGNIYTAVGDPDGSGSDTSVFVMTLPVRDGAVFQSDGSGAQVAAVDGVTYQVEGSFDLVTWTLAVAEVTPNDAFAAGLPTLNSGWTYRSFRVPGQTTTTPKAFIRVKFF
jgi:hypothetical protein